ncbi:alpha/beta fold hydrolase [Microbacterium atlanticum]|uniref:alpha/beta fold hydrolase n=1 Tax=Microbacterium atlanticum TaxID=2782168 RepID=UPI0018892998|nr:alpha/beta hydrolase [Microbacterium atlanticum]
MADVLAGGVRIAYQRRGHGSPLVLFHGAFEDSRVWTDTLQRLSPHADVIAWDAPGCGGSGDVPEGWTDHDWADAAAAFLRELGVVKPCVAGFSLGSMLALLLARDHPDAIGSLVLVGAYAGWGGSLTPDALAERLQAARFTMEHPVAEWADGFLDTVFAGDADPGRRAQARALLDDWRPSTTAALLDVASMDLRAALPAIRTPTVVVRGADDVRSSREAALDVVRRLPRARFTEIPRLGHDCTGPELDAVMLDALATTAH